MPQYKYIAVTQDNQKMTGSLSATNEEEARKELNELNLAILSIEETDAPAPETAKTAPKKTPAAPPPPPPKKQGISIKPTVKATKDESDPEPEPKPEESKPEPTPTPEPQQPDTTKKSKKVADSLTKFEFEAHDKTGRKIIGTIPATDKLSALTRLINEYQFDVTYLSRQDATQAEKDNDRTEGIEKLKERVADIKKATADIDEQTANDKDFKTKQQILLKKVDYVLEKIKKVLQNFDQEIKPENKKLIQSYIDKLLRIKNSTNLEYIEHTAEELLRKIQDQEIFLHKESLQKEKTNLMIESQQLLSSLHAAGGPKKTFSQDLKEKIVTKVKFRPLQNLLQKLAEKLTPNPDIISTKEIIKSTNKQLFTYAKLWLTTKDKDAKKQIADNIQSTLNERKELKEKLKTLKKGKHTKLIPDARPKTQDDTFLGEIVNFLGWLLSFYIMYYFITYYFTQKDIAYELSFPWDPHISETPLLKYLVAILMLWYILLAAKSKFMPKARFITPVFSIIGIVATALIVFNF